MLNDNVKVTPVFKTKEQEKLFSDCAEESMHKMMSGELPDLLTDEYISCDKVVVSPVFKTKEQEKLFSKCADESMFKHMNDEVSFEIGKQKVLKKR